MQRALAALHLELPHERAAPRIGVSEKLADIFLLKAHFGPGENASNHTQCAEYPDCPNGDIKSGKSNEVNKARDKERNKKQSPELAALRDTSIETTENLGITIYELLWQKNIFHEFGKHVSDI